VGCRRSHAVLRGTAEGAAQKSEKAPGFGEYVNHERDEIVYVSGETERPARAILGILERRVAKKLPLLYLVETTAMPFPCRLKSRPVEHLETRAEFSWADVASATAPIPSKATPFARKRCSTARASRSALIHAQVTAPIRIRFPTTKKLYKSAEEREEEARPIHFKVALFLVREGILDQKQSRPGSGSRQ